MHVARVCLISSTDANPYSRIEEIWDTAASVVF